jgi:hypothetical protein
MVSLGSSGPSWVAGIRKPSNFNNTKHQMSTSGIYTQNCAMTSTPDMLFFQGESVGGHRNARDTRMSKTLKNKMGSRSVRNINKCEHVFTRWSIRGRSGVDLGSYGIILEVRRCFFDELYEFRGPRMHRWFQNTGKYKLRSISDYYNRR